MIPLKDLKIGLSYIDRSKQSFKTYQYREGVGVAFGENFRHSTALGETDDPDVLFCVSLGTDQMKYWDVISTTAASQGEHFMHPTYGWARIVAELE